MRKPTAKMIEALVDLFSHNGGGVDGHRINTGTLCGLLDRGLVRGGQTYAHPVYLTDAGLAWLVDTRRAVVASDGTYICGNREPLTEDQVTAELTRFEADRAWEAARLAAKADANRAQTTPEFPPAPSNLIAGRGTVVHRPNPFYGDIPSCRTFSQGAGGRPHYQTTSAPVTCKNCGPDSSGTAGPVVVDDEERCDSPGHDAAACDMCRTEASERVSTGLIDATAMMLTEGRGSAITNFPNGSHAWTPVDRESEFDQAARRAPESAWVRPSTTADAAGALFPDAATPAKLAALGNETPDRVDAYIARAFSTGPDAVPFTGGQRATYDAAISDTQAAWELISGGPDATLTMQRLRRGLALTQADRTALADLLGTVRGQLGLNNPDTAWFNVSSRFIEHFGDPR